MNFPTVSLEILSDPNYSRITIAIRGNRTLSYSQCGNLESRNVALLHMGIMSSSLVTFLIHEEALKANIRLISIDYPGTGESTNVPDRSLQDWAADVEEFCNQVLPQEQRIQLVGHCLGVPHVLAVWARMMDRVSNITLAAPWVGDLQTNPWWMKYFVQRLPMQGYVPSLGGPLLNSTTYVNYPLSYLFSGELKQLLRAVHEMQAYNRHQGSAGNREMIRLALAASSKEDFWDSLLKQIAVKYEVQGTKAIPIQVYHGSSDSMVSQEACQVLVGWLKDAECNVDFTLIEDADHSTILMDPENMATILGPLGK